MSETTEAAPAEAFSDAYLSISELISSFDDEISWLPSGCRGWSIRDLVFHCLCDAQRGLVAMHSPTDLLPDRNAVTYWQDWGTDTGADTEGAANGRRYARVVASMFLRFDQLAELFIDTAAAVRHCATDTDPLAAVATQGHVLLVPDLLSTLAVEATVHHVDLITSLPQARPPSAIGLREVRKTCDGLLGERITTTWTDREYAMKATGRAPLSAKDRQELGSVVARFPLFC